MSSVRNAHILFSECRNPPQGPSPLERSSSFINPGWIGHQRLNKIDPLRLLRLVYAFTVQLPLSLSLDVEMYVGRWEAHDRLKASSSESCSRLCWCRAEEQPPGSAGTGGVAASAAAENEPRSTFCPSCVVLWIICLLKMHSVWAIFNEMSLLMTAEPRSLLRQPLHRIDDL